MDRGLVMDYAKMLSYLSKTAVCSYRCHKLPLASIALLAALPIGAQAASLKINPSDNADNVIELSGDLSASVTHTAEGMVIEIPGVEISLDCDKGTGNICTVTIGAGSTNSANNTNTNTTNTTNTNTTK